MIKLVVSDFDGTLMPYGTQSVSQGVKEKIRAIIDKNITVAISSGRTYNELIKYLGDFAQDLYFISCDGAYYSKNGKPLYEKKIEKDDINYFFSIFDNTNSFLFHAGQTNYSLGNIPSSAMHFNTKPVTHINEITEKVFKITSFSREIKLPATSGLRVHWDGGVGCSQFVNQFANKGTALSDLQTRLMLSKFDTACIGDSDNDISMMRNAKYTFAVGSRSDKLSAVVNQNVDLVESALDFCLN